MSVSYLGVPEPRTLDERACSELRTELNIAKRDRVIIHVGSMREAKNHAGLLRIFARIARLKDSVRLVLVGDGPERQGIERDILAMGLEHSVRLLGWRDDATALMQIATVILLPSIYEGLPIVAMEAGALRLPMVASDVRGIREATGDGVSALLHPVEDEAGLARSVMDVLESPSLATSLGNEARSIYEQNFSLTLCVQRLYRLYERAISRCRRLEAPGL